MRACAPHVRACACLCAANAPHVRACACVCAACAPHVRACACVCAACACMCVRVRARARACMGAVRVRVRVRVPGGTDVCVPACVCAWRNLMSVTQTGRRRSRKLCGTLRALNSTCRGSRERSKAWSKKWSKERSKEWSKEWSKGGAESSGSRGGPLCRLVKRTARLVKRTAGRLEGPFGPKRNRLRARPDGSEAVCAACVRVRVRVRVRTTPARHRRVPAVV